MLPGYIAGHYTHAAMHIDLARLCDRAGARFIQDCVADIDINGKTASLATHAPLPFDILSLDIGAAPDCSVAGAALYARPVKPIAGFIRHWGQVLASLRAGSRRKRITVVGGGAGSVEVVLAMAHAVRADPGIACKPRFTLVTRNA